MKKGIEMLFLLIGFIFSTKKYKFMEYDKTLKNIGVFRKVGDCAFKLYTTEEDLRSYYRELRNQPFHSFSRLPSNLLNSPVSLIYPPVIFEYIFDNSTNEEVVEILNQRVYDMFKEWFWRTNEEMSVDIPYENYPLALICEIKTEEVHDLTFYSYEFESLPSKRKSNYSVYSYRRDFSNNIFVLLTSLVEGMFGSRKGEHGSFEGDSDADSIHLEKIKDVIRENFNVSADQMIIVSKYESLLDGDKVRMFCKFKDATNSHIRLILVFIPAYNGGYNLDNALMMFQKENLDINTSEFRHIITSIRRLKNSGEVADNVNSFE